jgi:hypothetical protein
MEIIWGWEMEGGLTTLIIIISNNEVGIVEEEEEEDKETLVEEEEEEREVETMGMDRRGDEGGTDSMIACLNRAV